MSNDGVSYEEKSGSSSALNSFPLEKKPPTQEETISSDCVQLSKNIQIFRDRKMSTHALVYEGEQISGVFGILPIAVKLVTPAEIGIAEARILLRLNQNPHSHIISLLHSDWYSDGFCDYVYIALEKCHSETIRDFLLSRKDLKIPFDLDLMLKFCKQLNCGIEYIHKNNIIHKDLKPDNVFLSLDQTKVKIADFGMSQEIECNSSKVYDSGCFGTNGYRAPETFGGAAISQKTDIFSLGIIHYFLLSNGEHPFGSDSAEWNYNIKENTGIDLSQLLVPNIKTTQHLIKCSIEHELDCRPTIWDVEDHPCWEGKEVECNFDFCSEYHPREKTLSDENIKLTRDDREQYLKFLKEIKRLELITKSREEDPGSGAEISEKPNQTSTTDHNLYLVVTDDIESDADDAIVVLQPKDPVGEHVTGVTIKWNLPASKKRDTGVKLEIRNNSSEVFSLELDASVSECNIPPGILRCADLFYVAVTYTIERNGQEISFAKTKEFHTKPSRTQITKIWHTGKRLFLEWLPCERSDGYDVFLEKYGTGDILAYKHTQECNCLIDLIQNKAEPSYIYSCRVLAKKGRLESQPEKKTLYIVYRGVENLRLQLNNEEPSSAVDCSWKVGSRNSGYKINFKTGGKETSIDVGDVDRYTMRKLQPNTEYLVDVSEKTMTGGGKLTMDTFNALLKGATIIYSKARVKTAPSTPEKVEVRRNSDDRTSKLDVTIVSDYAGPFVVTVSDVNSNAQPKIVRANGRYLTLENLLPGTQYAVNVQTEFTDEVNNVTYLSSKTRGRPTDLFTRY